MGAEFDQRRIGLKPVALRERRRLLSGSASPSSRPTSRRSAQASSPISRRIELADAKVAFESTIVENGNWKLVWENNRECYHCPANHPELCKTFPETPTVSGIAGAMKNPMIAAALGALRGGGPAEPVSRSPPTGSTG